MSEIRPALNKLMTARLDLESLARVGYIAGTTEREQAENVYREIEEIAVTAYTALVEFRRACPDVVRGLK